MKSAVFYGQHDLRVEQREMPAPGPGEVQIQVKACGICGTDVHIYEGDKGAAEVHPRRSSGMSFRVLSLRRAVMWNSFGPETGYVSTPTAIAGPVISAGTARCISVSI